MTYQVVLQDEGYECISYTNSVQPLFLQIDTAVQIIFITAGEVYYENFRKQYYPELSNDVNINCLQKPIGNEELIQIVNEMMARRDI